MNIMYAVKTAILLQLLPQYVIGGHLEFPLTKRGEKEGTIDVYMKDRDYFFGIDVEVGNPPQPLELLVDTGSAYTWIPEASNPYCVDEDTYGYLTNTTRIRVDPDVTEESLRLKAPYWSQSQGCFKYGLFDPKLSESGFEQSEDPFEVTYVDKSWANGFWSKGRFKLDRYELEDLEFGLGYNATISEGILGLGIPSFKIANDEIIYQRDSFPMKLQKDGLINKKIFSIWMNQKGEEKGNKDGRILFGAVDHAKYKPPLYTMKMINSNRRGHPVQALEILVSDLVLNHVSGDNVSIFQQTEGLNGEFASALLDTGSAQNNFPKDMYDTFINQFESRNMTRGKNKGKSAFKCSIKDEIESVSFKFASKVFKVPMETFMEPVEKKYTIDLDPEEDFCTFNIGSGDQKHHMVLGLPFLRSVYTVFDLDTMQISMAPTIYTEKSEIQEITIDSPLVSEMDGELPEEFQLQFYDPKKEFVQSTKNGYYKGLNDSPALRADKHVLAYLSISISVTLLFSMFL